MELVKEFPQHVREGLRANTRDTQRYWEALNEYYAIHGCVVAHWWVRGDSGAGNRA